MPVGWKGTRGHDCLLSTEEEAEAPLTALSFPSGSSTFIPCGAAIRAPLELLKSAEDFWSFPGPVNFVRYGQVGLLETAQVGRALSQGLSSRVRTRPVVTYWVVMGFPQVAPGTLLQEHQRALGRQGLGDTRRQQ